MPETRFTSRVALRGEELYWSRIEPSLPPSDNGRVVSIDVESGEYLVDDDEETGCQRLKDRLPDATIWARKVGTKSGALRRYGRRAR